jgi:regulator of RNase E activity RraA
MLSVLFFCIAAQGQILQFTREQMIQYTANNPYDRFPGGRPKVPDELLKKLQDVSAEEVWTILSRHHYNNQFSDHWRIIYPEKHLIGRAVTAQFMPLRDIRGAHPTPISNTMLTDVNVPIRIGEAIVLPGDVVFGDSDGVYFIPPQFVKIDHR